MPEISINHHIGNSKSIQSVVIEHIPPELADERRWVLWRYECRDGKKTKVPFSAQLGGGEEGWPMAKANQPHTWSRLSTVMKHIQHFDGIGFMLGSGFAGIDLDKCRNPNTGELTEWAQAILTKVCSYAEVSPSNTGVKMLVRAVKPNGRCKLTGLPGYDGANTGAVEVYGHTRFFTITGQLLDGMPPTVEERQDQLALLCARLFPPHEKSGRVEARSVSDATPRQSIPDDAILERAMLAANGAKFLKLWEGDIAEYDHDHSRADQALCSMLAYWTGPDPVRIDTLFRQSGLYRDKWDRDDYRSRTIGRAIQGGRAFHEGQPDFADLDEQADRIVGEYAVAGDTAETDRLAFPAGTKFDRLAAKVRDDMLAKREYPLYHRGTFYVYRGNRYVEESDSELAHRIRTYLRSKGLGQSNNIIGNVAPIVQNFGHRAVAAFGDMPFFMGSGSWPNPGHIIAYRNGLLDLDRYLGGDFALIPHTAKWASTFCLPHDFEPHAACSSWLRFLDEVFEGDESRRNLLQEFFGYCLTHDTRHQKALVQVGKKRSGKGTCQAVLQELLGEANWTAYQLGLLVKDFGLSPLVNRLVAFIGEVELAGNPHKGEILERLKGIIGEDPQTINIKHKPLQTVKLAARFVIACNEMPHFFDTSRAISSRFLFLAYQRSFAGSEDTGLRDNLKAEISGINNWALEGLVRLKQQGGFTLPETHKSLLDDFDRAASPVAAFIEECLTIQRAYYPGDLPKAALSDASLWIERERCYELYEAWCAEHGITPSSRAYFGQDLRNLIPKIPDKNTKETVGGFQKRVYRGIGPKQEKSQ